MPNEGKKPKILEMWQSGKSPKEIARLAGCHERYVFRVIRDERKKTDPVCAPTRIKVVELAELIESERLDANKILREGLATMLEGLVARDETLRKDLGISCDKWRELVRSEEFAAFRAVLPSRRVVWGRAKTIAELKKLDGVT